MSKEVVDKFFKNIQKFQRGVIIKLVIGNIVLFIISIFIESYVLEMTLGAFMVAIVVLILGYFFEDKEIENNLEKMEE